MAEAVIRTPSDPRDETSNQEGGFAFRLIFRAVVAIGILLCTLWAFDGRTETIYRIGAGALALAGAFMFYAVGRPGRLYGLAIAMFCAILGGFGGVACFLDSSCVPRDRAWWMIASTVTFICSVWAANSYPKRSLVRLLSQALGIASAAVALYLAWYSRAFGGALLFVVIAVGAFAAAMSPAQQSSVSPGAGGRER